MEAKLFRTIHVAIPVRRLETSKHFFRTIFSATVIVDDNARRCCTVAYDKFEFSLFEMPDLAWDSRKMGPFHLGHEVASRADVDEIYHRAKTLGCAIKCEPFDREDGDYAFFLTDADGLVFEFFCGGHHLARKG